jgi:hypothetical protein
MLIADDNKLGLYRQCVGPRKAGNAQSACADALLIRPVVLNPLWGFNRKLLDQNELTS